MGEWDLMVSQQYLGKKQAEKARSENIHGIHFSKQHIFIFSSNIFLNMYLYCRIIIVSYNGILVSSKFP